MTSPFCRFSASFSFKYDVTDAILQDNEKMKVKYLRSLLLDMQAMQRNFVSLKFRCYGNQNQKDCLLLFIVFSKNNLKQYSLIVNAF